MPQDSIHISDTFTFRMKFSIQVIDYIEEHLTESIDYEIVAAQSFSSSYHFQRVFSILCGFTTGEYIRNRRLSLEASS